MIGEGLGPREMNPDERAAMYDSIDHMPPDVLEQVGYDTSGHETYTTEEDHEIEQGEQL